jgi:1-acyl-sn-glycerol-3-phosphate acyltransferase
MPVPPIIARSVATALGGPAVLERAERLQFPDVGHGYDLFGMSPNFVAMGDAITNALYTRYFRVLSYGHENLPMEGPGIVAANHSGTLPFDGMMIWTDVLRHTTPPRVVRSVADYFVTSLPFVSTLFARCGVVGGTRGNVKALLDSGELLLIFPEGTPGISKPFSQRYKLQDWRQGHVEMAIRYGAPVIPVAVVGAEEQMPRIGALPGIGAIPEIPLPATLVPLPVRYRIYYGAPIPFHEEFDPEDADDPAIVRDGALRVKAAVQSLIERGLSERKGIFT